MVAGAVADSDSCGRCVFLCFHYPASDLVAMGSVAVCVRCTMDELIQAIGFFFQQSWRFFSEIEVPLLGVSFGAFFIGMFLIAFGLKIVASLIGINIFGGNKDDK